MITARLKRSAIDGWDVFDTASGLHLGWIVRSWRETGWIAYAVPGPYAKAPVRGRVLGDFTRRQEAIDEVLIAASGWVG